MKIGLFGGSFDPIHKGHLYMARQAREEYGLDELWLIPTGNSPNKNAAEMTPARLRLAMAAAAIGADASGLLCKDEHAAMTKASADTKKHATGTESRDCDAGSLRVRRELSTPGRLYPYLRVCATEVNSTERSYTYLTLERLSAAYPEHSFYFLMGADSLDYFGQWRHPEVICSHAVILIVNREGFPETAMEEKARQLARQYEADIRFVHCARFDMASRGIRERYAAGEDCPDALTDEVLRFIRTHHLYRSGSA